MVKEEKFLLKATKSVNNLRYLLHQKFPLGKYIDRQKAAEEYAYCFIVYPYQESGKEKTLSELDAIKKSNEYHVLVDNSIERITELNRKERVFPSENIDFLCYFFECNAFNLFFRSVDECVDYEKKLLKECFDLLGNLVVDNEKVNLDIKLSDKYVYYNLAIKAIHFYLVFNPSYSFKNNSILINEVKDFFNRNIFPYIQALYNHSLRDFIDSSLVINISMKDLISDNGISYGGNSYRRVIKANKKLSKLMNQIYDLSPLLRLEADEGINLGIRKYHVNGYNQEFIDLEDLNNLPLFNFKRFESYNYIKGEKSEKILSQLEKSAINNWINLFDGIILALKVYSFKYTNDSLNNINDNFAYQCSDILENNFIFYDMKNLSLNILENLQEDFHNIKHAYEAPLIDRENIEKDIEFNRSEKNVIINKTNDNANVIPRLIHEYYQFNNHNR